MNIESLLKWVRGWAAKAGQLDWRSLIDWQAWAAWFSRVNWRAWAKWRVLRWVLLVPTVLIAILVALPFLIPVKVYKEQIIAQVRQATGRDLTIDGDLRLSFWPAFGVRVEKVGFANAPGAVDAQMATMDQMIVGAELLPLISGSLRVSEVRFVKPVIHLEVDKDGHGNWLLVPQAAPQTPAANSNKGVSGDVSFADVRVVDGVLTYRDARTGTQQRIDAINALVRLPSLDQPMTIEGGLTWNKEAIDVDVGIADLRALSSGSKSGLTAKVKGDVLNASFDGSFDPAGNAIAGIVDLSAASVQRLATWAGVNAGQADRFGAITLSGAVKAQGETVDLKDVKFSAGGETLQATFTGSIDGGKGTVEGSVDARTTSARELAKRAGIGLPGSKGFGAATVSGPVSIAAGRVALNKTRFSVDGDLLAGSFTGELDTIKGSVAGSIDLRSRSARQLAGNAGIALAGNRGFDAMTLEGGVGTSSGQVSFKDAKLSVDGDMLRASFTGAMDTATSNISGTIDLHSSSARELAARTGFQLPGTRGFGPLTVNGAISTSPGRFVFSNAALSVDGEILRANFNGTVETAASKVTGNVDLRSSSARELAARAGIVLPGTNGFGALAISGALNSTPQRIQFDNAKIALDGMHGSGDLTLTMGARTYAKGDFALDRLDLNQYTGGGGGHSASGGAIPPWSDDAIDFSGLRAADADLGFSVDALNAGGLRIGRSVLALAISGGKLKATLKEMSLYGGNGNGSVTLNGAGASPDVQMDLALAGVKAEPLLIDAAGVNRLSGVGNITLKLSSAGRSQRALMSALDGTVQIKLEDGAIKGANLAEIARTIQSVLSGSAIGGSAKTDFAELSATLQIANGVGRNEDLRLLNPFVRLTGAGTVDVANQRLDYRVEPRAVKSSEGQGGKEMRGIGIPFRIKGPWSKLSYSPDLSGVVNSTIDTIIKGGDPLENLKNETGLDQIFGKKKPKTPPGDQSQPPAPGEQPQTPAQPQPQAPPAPSQPEQQPPANGQENPPPQQNEPPKQPDPLQTLKDLLKPH